MKRITASIIAMVIAISAIAQGWQMPSIPENVVDYGHWNFMPAAQVMWDYFKMFSRDPQTKKLIYYGNVQ